MRDTATDAVSETIGVRVLDAGEVDGFVPALSEVLIDCVHAGASVSFMAPLTRERADAFWRKVAEGVRSGERALLVAEDTRGHVVGTVQLVLGQPENQPHRADVAKMLVHSAFRRRGIGAMLMTAVEKAALTAGKTLLVLDTVPELDGERLYLRLGWTPVGRVPGFALMPDGRPCDTAFLYKKLA
ncbi:GNAT family N-acetyltransferase [Arenibaculum pallidiluteum]|uniref:GNAT family N-acetyltransferase n=1 Tax=Arenibaculum pallidiluteum TaxID=2812559 RepID=UPI001F44897E|nr:GNAT family N-acetyltransferase [Arenibaculum pallidiluteum]